MRVLVVGGGGREHTLVWKIKQSGRVDKIYCAPGNAGTAKLAESVDVKAEDIKGVADFAQEKAIDLTVVGPEAPLVAGIVDEFERRGLRIFGPNARAAQIEGSKVFAKELMHKYGIPTAEFEVFDDAEEARDYIKRVNKPIVVKADGLAAGKGSIVCEDEEVALKAVNLIMVERAFGASGDRLIVEECLRGQEATIKAFTDGVEVLPMVAAQDYKPVFDGDRGPNTGGMGCYSPVPVMAGEIYEQIVNGIMKATVQALADEGIEYKGVLYAGIILTDEGPKVLEFNCRFGDPENQVVLPRLKGDLVEVLEATIDNKLGDVRLEWLSDSAVCVVLASGGYPGSYEVGKVIEGLEEAEGMADVIVFHAGTVFRDGKYLTAGGRVLGVTGLGMDFSVAIGRAYEAAERIRFEGMHYRRDIGKRAMDL